MSEFAEEYTCRYCFSTQRVIFSSAREWHYKSDGLFRIPDSAQGSVAVIISLWRMHNVSNVFNGHYTTCLNLRDMQSASSSEIDYAYLMMGPFDSRYELVLGEAKGYIEYTDEHIRRTKELADRFGTRPFLAFSTLKDCYSEDEKARLRSLASAGYKVIALTREELDPYDLYQRFAEAPHKYGIGLKELSENTVSLNL